MNKKITTAIVSIVALLVVIALFNTSVVSTSYEYQAGMIVETGQCWDSWNDHNNPPFYYYNDSIYISYGNGSDYDSWMVEFDTDTETFGTPVKVADNTENPGDSHGTPMVVVNTTGHLFLFNGAHVDESDLFMSTNPEDISSWTTKASLTGSVSYPNVAPTSDGDLCIFYRGVGTALSFKKYDTSANTYSGVTTIISSSDWWYPTSIQMEDDDTIHFGFNQRDTSGSGYYRNAYYLYTDDYGATFYNADGTDLDSIGDGLPLSRSEADTYLMIEEFAVKISGGARWCNRINVDDSGNPGACYLRNDNDPVNEEEDGVWVRYASWNDTGSTWDIVNVTTIPLIGYFGLTCGWSTACYPRCKTKQHVSKPFYQDNGDIIVMLSECEFFAGENVSNIKIYRSTDNGLTFNFHENITEDTDPEYNKWSMHTVGGIDNYVVWLTSPEFIDLSGLGWVNISVGYYEPLDSPEGSDIEFYSINGGSNDSTVYVDGRTFIWTRVTDATHYQLQLSNSSDFGTTFIDFNNISEGCELESMLGGDYSENSTHATFVLPDAYEFSYTGSHYQQVRAYTT